MTDWSGKAAAYENSFGRLCAGAIPFILAGTADLTPDAVALDVGTGTGGVASALAERFPTSGVDADEGMIEYASHAHPSIPFTVGALPSLPVESRHADVTTANFVVNHVAEPRAAVRELARVTKPRGRMIVTIWPSTPVNDMNRLWNRVIAASGATPPTGLRLPPEEEFPRTLDGTAALLAQPRCGLVDIRTSEITWRFRIHRDQLWSAAEAGIATIGATYQQQPDHIQKAMRTAFIRFTGREQLELRTTAILASARVG